MSISLLFDLFLYKLKIGKNNSERITFTYQSKNCRENKITGIIESTFSVENNSFGALVVHELKPGGASIIVTEENKREYVKLYVNYRFMRGIEQQFMSLQKGTWQWF